MAPPRSILSLGLPKTAVMSLTAAGYETLHDLGNVTVERLMQDTKLSQEVAEKVISLKEMSSTFTATQSVAAMAQVSERIPTGLAALDEVLGGGITSGHIVELSGPPGLPKDLVVLTMVEQYAKRNCAMIIADCQNMIDRRALLNISKRPQTRSTMQYTRPQTLARLMLFIDQLPSLLGSSSKESLLVLSCISPLFQAADLSPSNKTALLQNIKQSLAKLTMTNRLTVIITSQMATKFVNADGSPGTFDTGVQGVMAPQLGPAYLPAGKSWRVAFSPNSRTAGILKLLSSPQSSTASASATYAVERSPQSYAGDQGS